MHRLHRPLQLPRENPMRKQQQEHNQASSTEQLQERTQRDQEQRSKQALSNQGSQDRKPSQVNPDRRDSGDRGH